MPSPSFHMIILKPLASMDRSAAPALPQDAVIACALLHRLIQVYRQAGTEPPRPYPAPSDHDIAEAPILQCDVHALRGRDRSGVFRSCSYGSAHEQSCRHHSGRGDQRSTSRKARTWYVSVITLHRFSIEYIASRHRSSVRPGAARRGASGRGGCGGPVAFHPWFTHAVHGEAKPRWRGVPSQWAHPPATLTLSPTYSRTLRARDLPAA
ncbi:hypothetical protein ACQJBY_009504 [Aegilops geniculata]